MTWLDSLEVFCADVGSIPMGNFAWARRLPSVEAEEVHDPGSIVALADAAAALLKADQPVALGFEAPLYAPVPADPNELGTARPADAGASAPWSGGPGASVLPTGFVQAAWTLDRIHDAAPDSSVHFGWDTFAEEKKGVLLWEAFVTGDAKGADDEADARIGVKAFCDRLPDPSNSDVVPTERPISLIAAAALWAGFAVSLNELRSACVLVRA